MSDYSAWPAPIPGNPWLIPDDLANPSNWRLYDEHWNLVAHSPADPIKVRNTFTPPSPRNKAICATWNRSVAYPSWPRMKYRARRRHLGYTRTGGQR